MTNAVAIRPEQAALAVLDKEIERRRATLEASAASLIDPTRLKGVVLAAFTRNPSLWECDPISIARAVVESATYGLEPTGAIGGAHLVPYRNKRTGKKEAQLIIDYRGYIRLARRSGEVSKVWARTVRERDEFQVEAGTDERIIHRPYIGSEDAGNWTHVYAVILYRDGSPPQFDWDNWAWVESIRKRSKASGDGPWVTDPGEMAKKSILRRLLKTAPLTIEARQAIELEEAAEAEAGAQRQGRPSSAITAIHERLGVTAEAPTPPADGPEVEEGVYTAEPDEGAPEPPEPATAAACDSHSPHDGAAPCVRETGHQGNHRSSDKESWS